MKLGIDDSHSKPPIRSLKSEVAHQPLISPKLHESEETQTMKFIPQSTGYTSDHVVSVQTQVKRHTNQVYFTISHTAHTCTGYHVVSVQTGIGDLKLQHARLGLYW